MKLFRWRAIVPLALFAIGVSVAWYLLLDRTVAHAIERLGSAVVGAKVELAAADVRLADGAVVLRGLRVTDPNRPMTNLFQADELVVNVRIAPLLEKKVLIDTIAARGIRFGEPRETSGALERTTESGEVAHQVARWRERIALPQLDLASLSRVVDVSAISPDSLATLRHVRSVVHAADSSRTTWTSRVTALDPAPTIDSAGALVRRLQGTSITRLGLSGARDAAGSARATITSLTRLDGQLRGVKAGADSGVALVRAGIDRLDDARAADYAYARGLLHVPSLDAPTLAPALFGNVATRQLAPVLRWVAVADRFMPPGVRAKLREGKDRPRRAGTDVLFPAREHLPTFLLGLAELTLALRDGPAAGSYTMQIRDLTSEPTVLGRPTTFDLKRTEGAAGPSDIRINGSLDHVGSVIHDSVVASVIGIALPEIDLAAIGARLTLANGRTTLALARHGDSLDVRWLWRTADATWQRVGGADSGAAGRVRDVVWRTVSRLRDVEIRAGLSGPIANPRLSVGSNVAGAIATALRDELGAEVRRLERDIRTRVDQLVAGETQRARGTLARLEADVRSRIDTPRAEVERLKSDLEAEVRRLTRLPIGGR
ncbi:MAG TPA: hypothetical protein VGA37_05115 [Gemmatimonadales bacterium]